MSWRKIQHKGKSKQHFSSISLVSTMTDQTTTSNGVSLPSSANDKFIITWLDSNLDDSNEDIINQTVQLGNIINCVQKFIDADQCFNYVQNIEDKKVFIILSDSFDQCLSLLLTLIEGMNQIYSVYIISNDYEKFEQWSQQYKKLKGIFNDIEGILNTLKQDIHQCEINLVSNNMVSVISNELDPSYMYSKLLKEIILEIEYNEEARKIFIDYCRELYADNTSLLRTMDKFERDYHYNSAIWWYTREWDLYSLLNRALRTVDIDLITKMGFFIKDLHREIERLHSEAQYNTKMIVYRGQGMSKFDFEKMKKSVDGLLSFNNFLSTSTDREVSFCFAESNQCNPDLIGVLFQIEIDPSVSSTPFANTGSFSYYPDSSSEILFSTNSIFRISALEEIEDRLWQVNLTLTNDTDSSLECLIDCIRDEIKDENALKSLALLMNKMGHFDKALEINATLTETSSLPAENYYNIGLMHQSMGDYPKALSYFEKTLESDQNSRRSDDLSCAKTYNSMGVVYQSLGNYSTSLTYYEKAFELEEKILPPNHPSFSVLYNNIGEVYKSLGEYSKASAYYEKALKIQQNVLPCNHPSIAITYNNMGSVHRLTGNYSIALLLYKKTLDIERHCLLSDHPSFAITYNNIGLQYSFLEDYPTALTYYEKALAIAQKSSSFDPPSLALIYNNIGEVYDSMANYSSALSFYKKALEIQQKFLPANHPELAAVYNNIGEVHRSEGNYSTALAYYEKTLEIEQEIFPSNHPSLAITYTNMAVVFEAQERYEDAIKYTEQAMDILQHVFGLNHSKTKQTQVYLDRLQQKL